MAKKTKKVRSINASQIVGPARKASKASASRAFNSAYNRTGSGHEGLLVDSLGYLIVDSNGFPIAI